MTRGRPPKTTDQHKADGTYRPGEHGVRVESQFGAGRPVMPADLDEHGAKMWDMVCQHMPLSVSSPLDEFALADCCRTWSLVRIYHELLRSDPLDKDVAKVLSQSQEKFLKWSARFGMSPVDRARLKAPAESAPADDDPYATLLKVRTG
jgi:phage terminase small subunit